MPAGWQNDDYDGNYKQVVLKIELSVTTAAVMKVSAGIAFGAIFFFLPAA